MGGQGMGDGESERLPGDAPSASRALTRSPSPLSLQPLEKPSSWRIFCAIALPQQVCKQASEHIRNLKGRFPQVAASWNRDGKFHLTLKFIGEIPPAKVERVSVAADRATQDLGAVSLIVQDAGAFPAKGTPKVLWLGISDVPGDPSGRLSRLQARLEDECAQQGFAKEPRAFHPHLTLARLRKPEGARALALAHKEMGFAAVEFDVSELLVLHSELSSERSRYSVISSHRL